MILDNSPDPWYTYIMANNITAHALETAEKVREIDTVVPKDTLDLATEFFDDEMEAIIWLCRPQRAFGGVTPKQMCLDGKADEVETLIHRLEHGILI